MGFIRTLTCFVLSWVCLAATVPALSYADSLVITKTFKYSYRPGDDKETATAYARWGVVEAVLAGGLERITEAGLMAQKPTGLEQMMLGALVIVEMDSHECRKGVCTSSGTVVFDSEKAAQAINGIIGKPEVSGQFRIAKKEKSHALAEADALSARIAGGEKALLVRYKNDVLRGFSWNWYFMGASLAANGRHFEALESFTEFIRLRPGFARAHLARGAVYSKIGQHQRALSDYDMAVDISPGDARNYNSRGVAYYKLGDLRKAILDLTRAIQRDPAMASAYNNRGNAYLDSGNLNDAVADYNKALKIDPGYAEAYNSRGTAYNSLKKPDKALADFTRAIELNPEYPDAFNNRAVTLHRQGKPAKAIADYSMAIRLNSTYAEAYSNRGVAFQQLGKPRQALEDYSNAIFYSPNYTGAYLNRAVLNMNLKKIRQACADAEIACRLGDCRVKSQFQAAGTCK